MNPHTPLIPLLLFSFSTDSYQSAKAAEHRTTTTAQVETNAAASGAHTGSTQQIAETSATVELGPVGSVSGSAVQSGADTKGPHFITFS